MREQLMQLRSRPSPNLLVKALRPILPVVCCLQDDVLRSIELAEMMIADAAMSFRGSQPRIGHPRLRDVRSAARRNARCDHVLECEMGRRDAHCSGARPT